MISIVKLNIKCIFYGRPLETRLLHGMKVWFPEYLHLIKHYCSVLLMLHPRNLTVTVRLNVYDPSVWGICLRCADKGLADTSFLNITQTIYTHCH